MSPGPGPCPQAHATQLLEGLLQQQAPSRWLAEAGSSPAALNHVLGIFCWCRMHTSLAAAASSWQRWCRQALAGLTAASFKRLLPVTIAPVQGGAIMPVTYLMARDMAGGLAEEHRDAGPRAPVALACCALVLSCRELLGQLVWRLCGPAAAEEDLLRMLCEVVAPALQACLRAVPRRAELFLQQHSLLAAGLEYLQHAADVLQVRHPACCITAGCEVHGMRTDPSCCCVYACTNVYMLACTRNPLLYAPGADSTYGRCFASHHWLRSLSHASAPCHMHLPPVTCICALSHASAPCHMHLRPVTCICSLSHASAPCHMHLRPVTCICSLSHASAPCHMHLRPVTCICASRQQYYPSCRTSRSCCCRTTRIAATPAAVYALCCLCCAT